MRPDIVEPIKQYSEGTIDLQEAVSMFRQVKPAAYEYTDGPYTNEADEHEGGYTDLLSACMIYDCTAEELGHFQRAMWSTAIGPQEQEETVEFDETPYTISTLLDPQNDEDEDADPERQLAPDATEGAEPEAEVEDEEIEKHESHDQGDHGAWARSRAKVASRKTESKESRRKRKAIVSDARSKKRKRFSDRVKSSLSNRELHPVTKHTPGGQSHDQGLHGSWSDGSAPDTTSSGGEGASIAQSPPRTGADPSSGPSSPETPGTPETESQRPGGRTSRPKTLDALTGQDRVRDRLSVMVDAARAEGRPLDHTLLSGPPGLGKTTMAKALANEMGANIEVVNGPTLTSREALVDVIGGMQDGDILFIDEMHALPKKVEETLLPLLEDGEIDIIFDDGEIVRAKAPDITVIGATTNAEGIVKPLRDRFGANERLTFYKPQEMESLVAKTAQKKGLDLGPGAAELIAASSRGTPRAGNALVRDVSNYIAAGRASDASFETVTAVLAHKGIDPRGLTSTDRIYLGALQKMGGGGVNALSVITGESEGTISAVIEPYLMRQGFITRGSGGRSITEAGAAHIDQYGEGDLEIAKRRLSNFPTFSAPVEIAKSDRGKNLVFGWANVSHNDGTQVIDKQGHQIDVDELESAAYNFSVKYRKTGDQHQGEGFGDLVESMVITQDKIEKGGFPEDMLGKWWIGFKVPDEDWDRVESGERSMFSIQGRAQLERQ